MPASDQDAPARDMEIVKETIVGKRRRASISNDTPSPERTPFFHDRRAAGSLVTAQTYQRLQGKYRISLSKEEMVGLCMYLNILLNMGSAIPSRAFDAFLYSYPRYAVDDSKEPAESYHLWFVRYLDRGNDGAPGGVLDREILRDIVRENPYSATYAEECVWSILSKRGMDNRKEKVAS